MPPPPGLSSGPEPRFLPPRCLTHVRSRREALDKRFRSVEGSLEKRFRNVNGCRHVIQGLEHFPVDHMRWVELSYDMLHGSTFRCEGRIRRSYLYFPPVSMTTMCTCGRCMHIHAYQLKTGNALKNDRQNNAESMHAHGSQGTCTPGAKRRESPRKEEEAGTKDVGAWHRVPQAAKNE